MNQRQKFSFSVNNWQHLYSLQQAVSHNQQLTGSSLSIKGKALNQAFLDNNPTSISIEFSMHDSTPDYPLLHSGVYQLGTLKHSTDHLHTNICVDKKVFEELRKNLMEYADIEGIHIVVSIELFSDDPVYQAGKDYPIIELDYAMKGDS